MRNIREACRVVSFLSPIAGMPSLRADGLQTVRASKAAAMRVQKTTARLTAPNTPVGIVITRMGGN